MTISGWIFMSGGWLSTTILMAWCFYRLFKPKKADKNEYRKIKYNK